MEEFLQVNTIMIKNMGMAFTHGQMTVNTEAGGKRVNKTVLEFTSSMKRRMNKKCNKRVLLQRKGS